jgi:hypothetical protein
VSTETGQSRFSRQRLERSFDQGVRNASHLAGMVSAPVLGVADRLRAQPYDVGPLPSAPGHIIAGSAHRSTPGRKYLALAVNSLLRQAPTVGFAVFVNGPRPVQVVAEELRESGNFDGLQIEVVSEQDAPAYLLEPRSRIACIEPTVKGNPWRLTWSHKKVFSDLVLHHRAFETITHLVYSEDDMALPADALDYWCAYRPALAPHGLLPGFIRVEGPDDGLCVTGWRRRSDGRPRVALRSRTDHAADGEVVWFVNLSNPYQAMYVMDQELAEWHFRYSDFRSLRRSKLSTTFGGRWGVPERAAAGPIFDAPIPAGFHSRNVLPLLDRGEGRAYPLEPCLVHHLPWKDYRDESAPQGKRLVSETFTLDPPLASELANL